MFLSEGYTSNQLQAGLFRSDATNALKSLFAHQPYTEYSNYFNAYAISVASAQAGTSFPFDGLTNNTFFNSTFDSYSIVSIPPNIFDSNSNHGQVKVDNLLQTYAPFCHLPVLLVNDPHDAGGSDGLGNTAIATTEFQSPEILTHETGHVVANVADEYDTANPYVLSAIEEPNVTQETRSNYVKWNAWIPANTPIPTPPSAAYANSVGLFQGANYSSTNWYRPQFNCLMRSQYAPFCAICAEAMVRAFYAKVRPIDAFTPPNTNLSIITAQAQTFAVDVVQPSTHDLAVQWSIDEVPVLGGTNLSFTFLPQTVTAGSHTIAAVVRDRTRLVRNDPAHLLVQTVTWNLNVAVPQLRFDPALSLSDGRFVFRISGTALQNFVIQSSTNLADWQPLSTNTLTGGLFWFTNTAPLSSAARFFRAFALSP